MYTHNFIVEHIINNICSTIKRIFLFFVNTKNDTWYINIEMKEIMKNVT